jgi:hypothetical protein
MSYGFFFRVKDEEGNFPPLDVAFLGALSKKFKQTLIGALKLDPKADLFIISELKKQYKMLSKDFII